MTEVRYLNVGFWPKPKKVKNFKKIVKFGTFPELIWFKFVLKKLEKLWIYKKELKYWSLKNTGVNHEQKVVYADNPGKYYGTK